MGSAFVFGLEAPAASGPRAESEAVDFPAVKGRVRLHGFLTRDSNAGGQMRRYAASRTSAYLGIALLGLMLLLAGIHPAHAAESDITKYIVGGSGYTPPGPQDPGLYLDREGSWVELEGPMTIRVVLGVPSGDPDNPNGTAAGQLITLGVGETRRFEHVGPSQNANLVQIFLMSGDSTASTEGTTATQSTQSTVSTTTSQTTQTGQTTSTTQKGSSGLANLFFGLPNAQDVQGFAQDNGSILSVASSLAQGEAAESRLIKVLTGADGSTADYPNAANAAHMFKYIQALVGLKDDAGKPLFPSFQSKGIQKLLTLMAISAARDAKNSAPLEALGSFLAGMDMTSYKPAAK